MSRRRLAALIFVIATAFAAAMPAGAVTNGELDGDGHPAVVLILMEIDGVPRFRCSGTMITEYYVLTAGHCTGEPGEFSGMRIFTESAVDGGDNSYPFSGNNSIEAARWAAHPAYTDAAFFLHDVGMIELAEPFALPSGEYGQLPTSHNQFAGLKVGKKTTFTSVGYGLQQSNAAFFTGVRVRMFANPRLVQIDTGFTGGFSMLLSNNANTGGTCFGDSGGPNFLGGADSRLIAGVTSFGLNGSCGGTGGVFRIDKTDVLDFIADFMGS